MCFLPYLEQAKAGASLLLYCGKLAVVDERTLALCQKNNLRLFSMSQEKQMPFNVLFQKSSRTTNTKFSFSTTATDAALPNNCPTTCIHLRSIETCLNPPALTTNANSLSKSKGLSPNSGTFPKRPALAGKRAKNGANSAKRKNVH